MLRRWAAIICMVAAPLGAAACRDNTVDLGFRPEPGTTYSYRYEIRAVVTRALAGEDDQVSELDSVLLVDQEVLERTADGARVRVVIRRDGEEAVTAVALLDRAGSLQGIDAVEGLTVDALLTSAPVGTAPVLPTGRLAPGERWRIDGRGHRTTGRLQRLGVIDGNDVAVVRASAADEVDDQVEVAGSAASLRGRLRASSTITYDLDDGAVRESETSSKGRVAVQIAPPSGVTADPVKGTIAYELQVEVTRLD